MQRAARYVRVSTDHKEQKDSPQHQLATCNEYALDHDMYTDESLVYNDAGLSGTEMANRFEVQRLLSDARRGKFEVVLFTAISRFARDLSDALELRKRLERVYGIRIISIEEGYDSAIDGRNSEMVFTVFALLAAHKSKEMSIAIKRGLRQSAKRGRHIGNVTPYGYMKNDEKMLVPDPHTAPIVQDIYRLYLEGNGSTSIARILNGRGVLTPSARRGRKSSGWQGSTITAILNNSVYIGQIIACRWTERTDVEGSRRRDALLTKPTMRDESEWVVVDNAHPSIIPKQTYQRVQELFRTKASNRGMKRTSNLLAGVMVCSSCGGAMIVSAHNQYKYVVCSKTRRIGKSACDNHHVTKYESILDMILGHIQIVASSIEDIHAIHDEILGDLGENASGIEQRVRDLRTELEENRQEQLKNLRAFRQGMFPVHIVEQGQRELVAREKHIQDEIMRLQSEEEHQEQARERISDPAASLEIFGDSSLFDEFVKRLAIQKLIERIIFMPDGNIRVYYTWYRRREK